MNTFANQPNGPPIDLKIRLLRPPRFSEGWQIMCFVTCAMALYVVSLWLVLEYVAPLMVFPS